MTSHFSRRHTALFALLFFCGVTACFGQYPNLPLAAPGNHPQYGHPPMVQPYAAPQAMARQRMPQSPTLRLAAPLPTPPVNLPPLRLGTPSPQMSAPVMAARPQHPQVFTNDSALQYTAPKLNRQTSIYLAEPQLAATTPETTTQTPNSKLIPEQMPTSRPVAQWLQGVASGQNETIQPGPFMTDALNTGKTVATTARKTTDFALGISRCPGCGKRRPAYNRYRIGAVRTRNFWRTGEGQVKVASSPNARPAS